MIECKEESDGTLTITWDANHPVESILNDWTEQDFINAIMQECNKVLENEKLDRNPKV